MTGDNVTEVDYQVIDSDGKIHNYIWDDDKRQMVEGKREKVPPYWMIERIAEDLGGQVSYSSLLDSKGNLKRKISITYNE